MDTSYSAEDIQAQPPPVSFQIGFPVRPPGGAPPGGMVPGGGPPRLAPLPAVPAGRGRMQPGAGGRGQQQAAAPAEPSKEEKAAMVQRFHDMLAERGVSRTPENKVQQHVCAWVICLGFKVNGCISACSFSLYTISRQDLQGLYIYCFYI